MAYRVILLCVLLLFAVQDTCLAVSVPLNDPYLSNTWQYEAVGQDEIWLNDLINTEVVVAVIDTGVDMSQPDLSGRVVRGFDYVRNTDEVIDTVGHGTMMSCCIAANPNNALGFVGSAGNINIKIAPFRVGVSEDRLENVSKAIIDAANRDDIRIINMSFGCNEYTQEMVSAIDYARSKGKILIASAGNHGSEYKGFAPYYYPASYDGVISIGSVDRNNRISDFSQCNDRVDLYAPGESIITGYVGGGFGWQTGTSFATAIVSGICAVLVAKDPDITPEKVERILKDTALTYKDTRYGGDYNYCVVRVDAALKKLGEEVPLGFVGKFENREKGYFGLVSTFLKRL